MQSCAIHNTLCILMCMKHNYTYVINLFCFRVLLYASIQDTHTHTLALHIDTHVSLHLATSSRSFLCVSCIHMHTPCVYTHNDMYIFIYSCTHISTVLLENAQAYTCMCVRMCTFKCKHSQTHKHILAYVFVRDAS